MTNITKDAKRVRIRLMAKIYLGKKWVSPGRTVFILAIQTKYKLHSFQTKTQMILPAIVGNCTKKNISLHSWRQYRK